MCRVLAQMTPNLRRGVQSGGLEDVNEVAAGDDSYRVPVLADLPVSPGVKMSGSDQYAELAVP
jgi:hypothetical protein